MTMALQRTFVLLALLLASCSQGRLDVVGRAPNSLREDMLAYYSCDNATATQLPDDSGYGKGGTILGATPTPGRFGNALHFESENSVVVGDFYQATHSWSVALWVRAGAWASSPATSGGSGDTYVTLISTEIVRVGGWEMNVRFPQSDQDQKIWRYNFAYPNPADAGPWWIYQFAEARPYGVDVGLWTHLVAVVDSSVMKILFYKNGALSKDGTLFDERAITSFILSGSDALYLGTWSEGGRNFVGDLDDIVIYGRALTETEVASLYAQPLSALLH